MLPQPKVEAALATLPTSKTEHTPQLDARFGAVVATVVDLARPTKSRAGYTVIASFERDLYRDGALAHEMAAAPNLLKALNETLALAEALRSDRRQGGSTLEIEVLDRARAAIAKAEGRS